MKKIYLLFSLLLISEMSFAQDSFITTWEVTDGDLDVTIPVANGATFDFNVDFGDGTVLSNQSNSVTHVYSNPGIYTIEISGLFPSVSWNLSGENAYKIRSVEQWGTIQWQSMNIMFAFCRNMVINAIDTPDLSQVTDMSGMFWEAESMNDPLNNWDVSNVTNMGGMFWGAHSFNQPLNNWNVSNVVNMSLMFAREDVATNVEDLIFNQPLDNWNVSNVTDMKKMFYGCLSFNQPIGNWNVSQVTDMEEMFSDASSFNQPLDAWNVDNVTNMRRMFSSTNDFNQPLNSWNLSNVTDIEYMFAFTDAFNGDIGNWNTSGITSLQGVFFSANAFNKPIDNWNVSNVITMESTFQEASSFNQPIDLWNVSNVSSMYHMFKEASSFNQSLNSWNVSNVSTMTRLFQDATAFNGLIDNWNISGITSTFEMFQNAVSYNQPLNSWNVSGITSMGRMFEGASSFNQPLDSWDVSAVSSVVAMFQDASSFNQPLNTWNVTNVNSLNSFLDNTNLSNENYDLFLEHMVSLNFNNMSLGAEGLEYCSEVNRTILIDDRGWSINGDDLSQGCYSISGTISYDVDDNGCDVSEISTVPFFVNVTSSEFDFSKLSNNDGSYTISFSNEGPNTISLLNVPDYFTVSPESTEVTFTDVGQNEQVDFCISADQSIADLNVTLLPLTDARPGFEASYQMVIENIGTDTVSNISTSLVFDNTKQSFVSAEPTPVNTTANTLEFSISTLAPFESESISITMQTFTPPTVEADDILSFTVSVLPDTDDYTPNDNVFQFDQIVVNSFDPNDKLVLQGATIQVEDTDEYLDYIVRFQNTGSASAINVIVFDVLHPNLDWSSLKVTSASHDYSVEVYEENQVGFIFNNINLPDQATNEAESNGFIAYKIKPKATVDVGDIMSGNAFIIFDFNAPIVTNTVSTEVIDNLSIPEFNSEEILHVYPNPSNRGFNIHLKPDINLESLILYSIHGSKVLEVSPSTDYIATDSFNAGMYLLEIKTDTSSSVKRLIVY